MSRSGVISVLAALALGLAMLIGASEPALASHRRPAGKVPPAITGVRRLAGVVTGRPAGIARPRGWAGPGVRATARRAGTAPDPGLVTYNGGPVQQHPVVYLVFWGSWWASTTNPGGGGAAVENDLLQLFQGGIGQTGDSWSGTLSQYQDSSGKGPQFGAGVWGNWAVDTASNPPATATDAQIAAEAAAWADHWNVAGDVNAQIIVVSPHGDDPGGGFPKDYCAWHAQTTDSHGKFVAYTNLPYLPDAGASCGAATAAGVSIVAGHEFAETVTDPGAEATSGPVLGAWYDGAGAVNHDGEEIADKCAWFDLGTVVLPNGSYPMQRLWSNASSACVLTRRPSVTGLSTASGPTSGGTSVTVSGAHLLGGSVMFGTHAVAGSCLPATCSVQSPPGALGIVDVHVTTSGGQSAPTRADHFAYDMGPGDVTAANGRCLNDAHNSKAAGNKIDIWACTPGRLGQAWLLTGGHTLQVVGRCLSLTGLFSGARAVLADCAGLPTEFWRTKRASGGLVEYVNPASGLCLTDPRATNGTGVIIRGCANLARQRWSNP